MSRVLVSGGAGYIGSHAVRALLEAGHTVVVLDDLSAGHAAAVPSGVPLVRAGMHDTAAVARALTEHSIDAVMHFAAWLDVGASVGDPLGYYHNNVTGTLSVLGAMRQAGVQRFIFSSTCATYGEPDRVPMDESLPMAPINAYGQTKLAIEHALPHIERAYGIRWTALRYFNAAGAHPDGTIGEDHEPEIHLIPRAIQAATGGLPLKVFGEDYPTPDGTCLRDYIHVSDLADAHVRALAALNDGAASAVYNVGTGTPQSVRQVIDTVSRVVGQPVQWTPAARRPGDPAALFASSQKIQQALGWRPRFPDLETIVAHAWAWHRGHPRGYDDRPPRTA
ncbi:MAG: UDP-glucose 4-epimerase GalE [Acidobacteria bacterium]|nr:UDP-glucose 4-epimerase GalE [Acidobacteriota bacterium]